MANWYESNEARVKHYKRKLNTKAMRENIDTPEWHLNMQAYHHNMGMVSTKAGDIREANEHFLEADYHRRKYLEKKHGEK